MSATCHSGVRDSWSVAFTAALAHSSARVTSTCALPAAAASGVRPVRDGRSSSALACSSTCAAAVEP